MCTAILASILGISSYVWLFVLPILGTFCGIEAVLRLSLLLYVQTIAGSILPASLVLAEPLLQLAVSVALLSLPLSVTPTLIVWFYDKLLWVSEPIWLTMEAVGVVYLTVTVSRKLIQRMDESPGTSKATILCIAAFSYCLFFDLSSAVLMSKSLPVKWLLVFVIFLTAAVHLAMWMSDYGVLSDASVVCMTNVVLVYSLTEASNFTTNKAPDALIPWASVDHGISFIKLLLNVGTQVSGNVTSLTDFMVQLFTPWYLASMIVRVASVLIAVSFIIKNYNEETETEDTSLWSIDDDTTLSSSFGAWRSPLIVRLTVIFVYTQFVVYHLMSSDPENSWLVKLPALEGISLTRIVQIVLVNGTYLWYLRSEDSSD